MGIVYGVFKDSRCPFLFRIFGSSHQLQLYSPPENISQQLKLSLIKFINHLKVEVVEDREVLKKDQPLAVVCPNTTRLEADINNSLSNITDLLGKRDYLIFVVHFGNASSLPVLTTEQKLSSESYKGAKFVDIAFNRTQHIYSHKINANAKDEIDNFLMNYKTK